MDQSIIVALFTLVGAALTAYISWRLGHMQIAQQSKGIDIGNGTQREIEFREDLLALIERQEKKLTAQDDKIDRMDTYIEANKKLVSELKLANLNLSIQNQRLQTRLLEIEAEAARLKAEVDKLKNKEAL